MNHGVAILVLSLVSLVLVNCAGKPERDRARPTQRKSFSDRLNETNGYKQDETGNWVPRSDKRSSFETMGESLYFKGTQQNKKEFKTGEYKRRSWWGNKEFKVQEYQGDTDGSRFQTTARQQGVTARESGSALDLPGSYATDSYATGTAREQQKARTIPHAVDAETEARRRVYEAPEILNWHEQRAISREETKSLLGR